MTVLWNWKQGTDLCYGSGRMSLRKWAGSEAWWMRRNTQAWCRRDLQTEPTVGVGTWGERKLEKISVQEGIVLHLADLEGSAEVWVFILHLHRLQVRCRSSTLCAPQGMQVVNAQWILLNVLTEGFSLPSYASTVTGRHWKIPTWSIFPLD